MQLYETSWSKLKSLCQKQYIETKCLKIICTMETNIFRSESDVLDHLDLIILRYKNTDSVTRCVLLLKIHRKTPMQETLFK